MGFSQQAPFTIAIEAINIDELGGLQSYAFGQSNGKWLIVGGRLDGLHRRQPWATFDVSGHNNQLIVIDPVSEQKWTASLSSLPVSIQEQLSSTNMEFHQRGDYLYCFGGYGYSATEGDHTTYAQLTAIDVPSVIDGIINGTGIAPYFRQITDSLFQVSGGRISTIYGNYYLLGGQKFLGRYNPMGPTHGPGFVQEYTNSIRIFSLSDDGTTLIVNHLPSHTDSENLHRRDYNAAPQILPNGEEGITMFSGVFQQTVDLPYLNCVNVDSVNYAVNDSFQQYYNHYHCAVFPMYSASNNEMHTLFFGGIAQYYDVEGTRVQDDDVPFVRTIARVTRNADGIMTEHKLPVEMPALLGAGAEFIPNKSLAHYPNEVVKLDSLGADTTLIGHIYGGISSSAPNIFFLNDGTQSEASSQIFRVYLIQDEVLSINEFNPATLSMSVYPNPSQGMLHISYSLMEKSDVTLIITDIDGAVVDSTMLSGQHMGENTIKKDVSHLARQKVYLVTLKTGEESVTEKVILE